MSNPSAVTLTPEQLQDIISSAVSTAVREGRKPADPTPDEVAAAAQAKQMRKDRAELEKNKKENQKLNQSLCDHSREDGTSACVAVYNNRGNVDFLICQTNQCIIRPGQRPTGELGKDTEMHIYDTQIFNREYRRSQKRPSMAS